ncbi:hypothetical protein CE91St44_27310 [Oscillospiraceae bacterium]|nr:hypothetical protein CE91St44_27310 [Oscillospiraceae bacterium]
MKSMQNIIQSLNVAERFNSEVLYSFIEFQKVIQRMGDDYIETDDCIITPYYVFDGKRMELYEYKLYIHLVNTPNFEKYLLRKTGRFKVSDIPKDVIILQKNCYFEILKTERKISSKKIQQYLDFLLGNNCLKAQVEQALGEFSVNNLLFEFY